MCPVPRDRPEAGKRKEKTMTVKRAMAKVCNERETFPDGWNTDLKEVYAKSGKTLYTRRQKKVWVMFAYNEMNHEADEIKVFRTEAKAKAAMEEDIENVMGCGDPSYSPEDLVRDSENEAHLADELRWKVTYQELFA
jgi:hypothetical protein